MCWSLAIKKGRRWEDFFPFSGLRERKSPATKALETAKSVDAHAWRGPKLAGSQRHAGFPWVSAVLWGASKSVSSGQTQYSFLPRTVHMSGWLIEVHYSEFNFPGFLKLGGPQRGAWEIWRMKGRISHFVAHVLLLDLLTHWVSITSKASFPWVYFPRSSSNSLTRHPFVCVLRRDPGSSRSSTFTIGVAGKPRFQFILREFQLMPVGSQLLLIFSLLISIFPSWLPIQWLQAPASDKIQQIYRLD